MGRKHRSSSLSSSIKPRSTSISSPSVEVDIDSATTLFNHFLHEKDSIGRTFLHHAISVVADPQHDEKSNSREDGYALISGVCERAKELDKIRGRQHTSTVSSGGGSHLHKLMLTRDEENGYTPLHSAIVRRDLTSLLILLKQASMEDDESDSAGGHSMAHPLRLLGQTDGTRVMKDLAGALDNEGLSPLRLLGATSEGELEKCRETMHWSYLKRIWKSSVQPCNAEANPRRGRQRMVSFGDERDYLNNDVEASVVLDRRSRSGSFHVDDLDEEEDDEQQQAVDTDLLPLGDVDFTLLVEPADARRQSEDQVLSVDGASVDYGCELYTFGRADHCALGVPQFGTGGRRDKLFDDSFERNAQDHSSGASHKPRRVGAFALGDMRRDWSSSSIDKDAVDSPVVAVAAAAHHTLAVTRGGRLFAFGLGKGGRLGTGDENHRSLPTRVLGPLSKRIVTSIAAAENHSLCATAFDGGCYAWGSNGFGQLGLPSEQIQGSRLSPRRVDELKSLFVVAVAAGDRHSVALTKVGEVYCWGDNKAGQCGGSSPASPSPLSNRCCHQPTRVEALAHRVCIAISASEFSTLALTRPPTNNEASLSSLPVNVVYGWGLGSHIPLKVNFPTANNDRSPIQNDSATFSRVTCINPVAISSAKYHNVAITADGRVYTWGISKESLGLEKSGNTKSTDQEGTPKGKRCYHNSVQLVVGMLPENGGGRAVAVSASESHTAVVCADGHLYTWGSSYGNNTLGHKGVKWQPSPRKVKRVHRAVGLAAAREHTALLIGTSFPSLPHSAPISDNPVNNPLSLKESSAVEISRNVDLSNVIPIAAVAHHLSSKPLLMYCEKFIQMNLDGVLSSSNISDLESFLANKMSSELTRDVNCNNDGVFHPFIYRLAKSNEWMQNSADTLKSFKGCLEKKQRRKADKLAYPQTNDNGDISKHDAPDENIETATQPLVECQEVPISVVEKKPDHQQAIPNIKSAADVTKYYCDVCAISCPDSSSYTLHMSGRKHRNRLNHARQEEEKEVAERMMNTKRMQLMGIKQTSFEVASQVVKSPEAKSNAWASPSPQPTKLPTNSSSSDFKPRSNSLRGIMNEELKAQTPKLQASKSISTKAPASGKKLTFSPQPGPPLKMVSTTPNASLTLSSFILPNDNNNAHGKALKSVKASWAASKPSTKSVPAVSTNIQVKSFADIQKEEQDRVKKQDHMCHIGGNKWFVEQRERAASIGEIQQKQQEDAEWLQLVEEQKRIEEEIAKECKIKARKEKAKNRNRNQKKKSASNNRSRKQPAKSEVCQQG